VSDPPFRVSHVIFDIDGTLMDPASGYEVGIKATAAHLSDVTGRVVTPEALRAEQRRISAELRSSGMPYVPARVEGFRHALARLGNGEEGVGAALQVFIRAREPAIEPYSDVEPALDMLSERGFVLVAASNGTEEMVRHPVFRYFAATWLAHSRGVRKPDPSFFRGVLEHVGARPEAALMVGDRLDNDYEPARSVGMTAVLIDREARVEDSAITRISALTELPALLERA
jgi:putative hydrolase of the HAD superfamily